MKAQYKVALAVAVGFGFAAIAVQGLHAQIKPKVFSVENIQSQEAFKTKKHFRNLHRKVPEAIQSTGE